ncbi:MAG: hypothetical protein ACP5O6_10995 [Candidatus Baltobacteraceae bacterium]
MNLTALPPLFAGGDFGNPSLSQGALPLQPVASASGAPVAFALSAVVPPATLSLALLTASALKVAAVLARGSGVTQQASAPGILPTGNLHDHAMHRSTVAQLAIAALYPHEFFSAYA